MENALENMREEIGKARSKGEDEERRWREREEELLMRLEDSRASERKLQDTAHNLEVCLADATQQIQELKVCNFHDLKCVIPCSFKLLTSYYTY